MFDNQQITVENNFDAVTLIFYIFLYLCINNHKQKKPNE